MIGGDSGWQAQQLCLDQRIWLPAYAKTHSWGEYVFDWAWARAYQQYGLAYYPKLILAAPYTPSTGPRLLGATSSADAKLVVEALKTYCHRQSLSSFHILFPREVEQRWLDECGLLKRTDVQFHWHNNNYRDFADFLDRFTSRKRKNVRKERLRIAQQNIQLRTIEGADVSSKELHYFYQFYHATYLKRGRQGYLNKAFFSTLLAIMPEQIVLILAEQETTPIAAALFFKDKGCLYGRYWGCIDEYNNLHFETCYYQGIEYCIAHGLQRFDPGTQGEHKLARGFEPTYTHSYHWLAQSEFFAAVAQFCDDERRSVDEYFHSATCTLPFKETEK